MRRGILSARPLRVRPGSARVRRRTALADHRDLDLARVLHLPLDRRRDLVGDQRGPLVVDLARDPRSPGSRARRASRRPARRRPGARRSPRARAAAPRTPRASLRGPRAAPRRARRRSGRSPPPRFAARPRCGGPPSRGRPPRARRGAARSGRRPARAGPRPRGVTALPMSWSSAARRAVSTEAPSSAAIEPGELRALDQVVEDVLAVAGAELQLAEQLHQLRVEAVHPRLERRPLALLDDSLVDLAPSPARRSPRSAPDGSARRRSGARA